MGTAGDKSPSAVRERLHAWVPEYAPGRASPGAAAPTDKRAPGAVSTLPARFRKH